MRLLTGEDPGLGRDPILKEDRHFHGPSSPASSAAASAALLSSSPTLRIVELELTHDTCIATGRTSCTLLVCQQLASIATRHGPSPAGGGAGGTEVDLELEAACRHVHTLIAATCFPQAAAAAKALFTACCHHNRQLYHVRCLLLMALLHLHEIVKYP
ncbi:hypothetical protein CLOM_g20576 [Closterium sp. NIES-68]|nr:hypothetical protein CLOM_g20576 [Closterium sp. NIES-68]